MLARTCRYWQGRSTVGRWLDRKLRAVGLWLRPSRRSWEPITRAPAAFRASSRMYWTGRALAKMNLSSGPEHPPNNPVCRILHNYAQLIKQEFEPWVWVAGACNDLPLVAKSRLVGWTGHFCRDAERLHHCTFALSSAEKGGSWESNKFKWCVLGAATNRHVQKPHSNIVSCLGFCLADWIDWYEYTTVLE